MKNIWKKISAGLLAFALVFTTIPPIGASADTTDPGTDAGEKEESLINVSSSDAFSLPVQGGDYVYVLEGKNPEAEVYITGNCDIILRDAAVRRIYTNSEEKYTVNITLEGANIINQNTSGHQGALEVNKSNVTINGGENDSLNAKSDAFCVYSYDDEAGGLTVNGGNITFESATTIGSPLQTTYTQNGGTVKTKNVSGNSFQYNLYLNGGTLEVDHKAANSSIFGGPVKIKNGASMKVTGPEEPDKYFSFNGPIGLADDAAADDCLLVRFDNSSDFVYLDEENEILRDKTYAEIKAVTHVHEYENGICSCNYSCVHDTDDGTCSLCEAYIYKIKHQPTEAEPYVVLNDGTEASYQWYEVKNISEITNESKIYPWSYFGAPFEENSTYDAKAGWTPIQVYEDDVYKALYYIIAPFAADDKVTLRFSSPVEDAGLFIPNEASAECELDGTVATATIPSDGVYGISAVTKTTEPTVKVYVGDAEVSTLAGQTGATLSQYAHGGYYYCEATAKDGTVLISNYADFTYKITHQPTDKEQYVSLNNSTGANYQWYVEKEGIVPVTDENAFDWSVLGVTEEIGGTYDNETGWTPDEYGNYFLVWLEEGEIINFDFSQTPSECVYLFSTTGGEPEGRGDISEGRLTADANGYYVICAEGGGNLKATFNGTEFIAVSGQTDATLNASEPGRYRCEVTFGNGKKETSDVVEVLHLHTGGTATCKDKAICSNCGMGYGPLSKNHTPGPAATCTTPQKCTVCQTELAPAKGHTPGPAATSTTPQTCTVCLVELAPAKGSTPQVKETATAKLSATKLVYNGKVRKPTVTATNSKGTKLKEGTDYSVKYAAGRKAVGRYKVTVTFKGKYTGTKTLYFNILPKAPTSTKAALRTVTGGYDDIKVTWKKATGADGYKVYYKKSTAKEYTYATSVTGTSYTKKNLSDGVKYTFKIVPYFKSGSTKYTSTKYSTASATTLKKVTGVKVVKSGTKVKVSWKNISGESGYQISKMTKKKATQKKPLTYKTTSGKYKKLSATKGKTYYYKVRAYKTVGTKKVYGPWSTVKSYKRK